MKKSFAAGVMLFFGSAVSAGSPDLDRLATEICAESRLYQSVAHAYVPLLTGLNSEKFAQSELQTVLKNIIVNLHNVKVKDGTYSTLDNRVTAVQCTGTMTIDTTWYSNRKETGSVGDVIAYDVNFFVNFPNGATLKEYLSSTFQIEYKTQVDTENVETIKASKRQLNLIGGRHRVGSNVWDERKYNNGKTNDEVMLARYTAGEFTDEEWQGLNNGKFRSPRAPQPGDGARLVDAFIDYQQQAADEMLEQYGIRKGSPEYNRILTQAKADAEYQNKFRRAMAACGNDQSCKVAVVRAMTE